MKPRSRTFWLAGAAAALVVSQLGLAYATPRSHTVLLLGLFGLALGGYALLLRLRLPWRPGLLLALLLRLLWLPALPALSDDYHRFRWDGILVAAGQNPFQHRPEEYTAGGGQLAGPVALTAALYQRLNSPRYYSVYPPVCQALFGAAAWLLPGSERGQVVLLRLVLLLAEAATALLLARLLRRFRRPAEQALLYLLHPMVVAELVGNLHFEALVITGMLTTIWLLARGRWAWAAAALSLPVATKLTPLLATPLLLRRLGWARTVAFGGLLAVILVAVFAPFASAELLRNIGRSLDLYFHSFEFNASVYYALRALRAWQLGYNDIARLGTVLAACSVVGILVLAALEKRPSLATLPRAALLVFTLYYLLATTVHPWYLAPLVALSCFTGWCYPATWASLAALSYATYHTPAYHENLWLVAAEYAGVAVAAYFDWHRRPHGSSAEESHAA
ncbi:glycosyltransferase 87 family protein [Hymenobacter sp. CRA2]|uniref:glycosyltransferase 87 family protein n=1 Tax=Hymenobacter sp. CRA2 TaxID=1955620 RepID=UPI00098E8792|nr:glycosyltransferase 87 family protein [Hymenobacter sp. CRA2]OON70215.1 hypothetical protein B0919_05630 [Hymenobacter sp. CRA2]